MLATSADSVPTGSDWRYEVKFDGYRALAFVRAGDCRLVSRNGNDLTQRFAEVAKEVVSATKSPNAVLDGEVCRIDANGRASFSELQQGSGALVFYVFDLLELDGEPVVDAPFEERKERLRALLDARNPTVRFSDDFADGAALFEAAQERGLEGVVAKRSGSPYRPGRRTREWLKVKATNSDEFVVVGYTRGAGRREGTFGSLVLGVMEEGELRYVGNVGTGFDDAEIARLLRALRPLHRETTPFAVEPKLPRVRKGDVQWVEPKLIAQVRYGEWTHDRHLRHPSYLGLRDDKAAGGGGARRTSSAEGGASSSCRISRSCSGRTKGSRRAICSATTASSRRCSCRTSRTGRSRCAATRRRQREGVLPEGRAVAHAGLDPALSRARLGP